MKSIQLQKDIFNEILPLSIKMNEIINDVFTNNERIMEQFIKDLFLGKVQVSAIKVQNKLNIIENFIILRIL